MPCQPGNPAPAESPQGELKYEAQLQSEDLGERMAHALRHVQREGHSRALLVGTDVPDLSAAVLQAALAALQTHQVRARLRSQDLNENPLLQ